MHLEEITGELTGIQVCFGVYQRIAKPAGVQDRNTLLSGAFQLKRMVQHMCVPDVMLMNPSPPSSAAFDAA